MSHSQFSFYNMTTSFLPWSICVLLSWSETDLCGCLNQQTKVTLFNFWGKTIVVPCAAALLSGTLVLGIQPPCCAEDWPSTGRETTWRDHVKVFKLTTTVSLQPWKRRYLQLFQPLTVKSPRAKPRTLWNPSLNFRILKHNEIMILYDSFGWVCSEALVTTERLDWRHFLQMNSEWDPHFFFSFQ